MRMTNGLTANGHHAKHGVRIGMLVSRLRDEEKTLLQAAARRGIAVEVIQDRQLTLNLSAPEPPAVDVVLDRCLAHVRGGYAVRMFDRWGIPTVNSATSSALCDDKVEMSAELTMAGIPTPRTMVAFSIPSALAAAEELGYPVVVKPAGGSWGRLLSKVNSPAALETILTEKLSYGGPQHGVFYLQEYVEKPGRDIRVLVIGDEIVAASYRNAEHWITNVAKGAASTRCEITPEIADLTLGAAQALGVELAGVDLLETPDGLQVIEVNSGVEFKGLRSTTDHSIPDLILDHVLTRAGCTAVEAVA